MDQLAKKVESQDKEIKLLNEEIDNKGEEIKYRTFTVKLFKGKMLI